MNSPKLYTLANRMPRTNGKLPLVFAVMDMAPTMPSQYYIFIAYDELTEDIQRVHNTTIRQYFSVHTIEATNRPYIYMNKFKYNDSMIDTVFWYTGIDISSEDTVIPVIDFKEMNLLYTPDLACVHITGDSVLSKVRHQNIVRDKRAQIIQEFLNQMPTQVAQQVPAEVPTQQAREQTSPIKIFSIPSHAASLIVKGLIHEKMTCTITANSFDEIAVVGITPCFHCFDYEALSQWLLTHTTCPDCRTHVLTYLKYTV